MEGEGQAGVWLLRIVHSLFQISLFYFSVHEFLSACMYGHHASAWFPWRSEEGSGTLELESQMTVNHQGSTGDCGPFGRGVMAPSQISRPSTLFCKMVGVSHWTRVSWARMTGLFVQCLPSGHHHPWLLCWCWGANTGLCGCKASVLLSHLYSPSSTMWTFQSISRCPERIYVCVLANERGVIHSAFQRERYLS